MVRNVKFISLRMAVMLPCIFMFALFCTAFSFSFFVSVPYVTASESIRQSKSGDFLVALIAQKNHDWETAGRYLERLLVAEPENEALRHQAMILFLGSGKMDRAVKIAKGFETPDDMTALVLALYHLRDNRFDDAAKAMEKITDGQQSRIIKPLVQAWVQAGLGKLEVEDLVANPLYIYDAVAVATYLGRHKNAQQLIRRALGQNGILAHDLERLGDLFLLSGQEKDAKPLYQAALKQEARDRFRLTAKIAAIENGIEIDPDFLTAHLAGSVQDGLARSIFDVSTLLFRQGADTPSRLYISMALTLHPDFTEPRLLLAHILAYEGRYEDALDQYAYIPKQSDNYLKSRRKSAEILEEANRFEEAIKVLSELEQDFKDVKSRIQIGNIYRRQEDYKQALKSYNIAFRRMDKEDKDIWNLYYLRGMTYERLQDYTASEKDLRAALNLRPDNPYILNYLGYSMAEQGRKLTESLELIEKAVRLQPSDGYITDSLGWVLYRLGRYEEALPHLEKAVELLPYDAVINNHLGDVYWQVGRKIEARFQWSRALNHSKDETLTAGIEAKMKNGLGRADPIHAAQK